MPLAKIEKSPALQQFVQAIQAEKALVVEGLWETPKAALLALAHKTLERPILVITGGAREERLASDCLYFGLSNVLEFPSWETLPGEEIAPSSDIVGKRLEILAELAKKSGTPRVLICPLQACLQKIPPPTLVNKTCRHVKKGDEIPFLSFQEILTSLGYRRTPVASDKGEFAVRGGIVDLFPLSATDPVRIEFFGDTIDAIRIYDPISQKSIEKKESFFLSPASETTLLESTEELSLLLDYLGKNALIIFDDLVALEDRYVAIKNLPGARSRLFTTLEDFFQAAKAHRQLYFTEEAIEQLDTRERGPRSGRSFYSGKNPFQAIEFSIANLEISAKRWQHPFVPILDYFSSEEYPLQSTQELPQALSRFPQETIIWLTSSEPEEKGLRERLKNECSTPPAMQFEPGYLSSGFALPDLTLSIIPMTEFTHRYKVRRQKWRTTYHTPAAEFHELAPGDIVVHFHHGIGRYIGTEKRTNHLGQMGEFLTIEYAEGGKLYVPIQQAYLVSRYIGAHEETPSFHVIGGKQWMRSKAQAEKAIVGYAHDLLRLQAERSVHGGFAYPADASDMISFEEEFPYAETDDQLRAIADVKHDMQSGKAMDRLVCGDVGYGKTEVAMRAAFKAVADGKKQVAVLVPTTVLALQHYENFKARMANFPIRIAIVSRFQTTKEIKNALKEVADGTVDILIGTHRLISKDVRFHNLGLIIIDEEQRFGVRAKEHLKTIKTGVDCLTLSATPIPRTLYMSLVGAREISVINTPPHDRLPIKSMIVEREPATIHNALLRELARDGQAFFIHNRVESIFKIRDELQQMLPEARIVVGHGQMPSEEIDAVFHAFKSGEADILLATTIVENGIDIPNANTILIDHSDKFGIADLYQMRGRVGRWNRPAYAYFLIPRHKPLGEVARKRLFALVESSGYGGGMKIAMRDLEIRGAGDILGTQQSGQVSTIGFHLYCKLLKRAIDALGKKTVPDFIETKMEFSYDARLPEEYIAETSLRMEIYHRLGETMSSQELDELMSELKDRFGPPPPPVHWLKALTAIKIASAKHRIIHMKFDTHTLSMEQQKGKESRKLLFPLQRAKTPHDLENQVLAILGKI